MIAFESLSKHYGSLRAVSGVSFTVEAGSVVGFLGRNGAGKSTSLRVLAGLARPTEGSATIDGRRYRELSEPLRAVGFGLDADTFHPAISGNRQLASLARRGGIPHGRVKEVLDLVELCPAAERAVRGYSLGMRQRLLLAAAMLGDPGTLVLDEPTNGLDPQGHRWLRDFLRRRAGEGRAVLLSSHVLGDVAQTVDRVVVISHGRVVADGPIAELAGGDAAVRVSSPGAARLAELLRAHGATVSHDGNGALLVTGTTRERVGEVAADGGIVLHELASPRTSLEDMFFALSESEGAGLR